MNFELPEELRIFKNALRRFVDTEMIPVERQTTTETAAKSPSPNIYVRLGRQCAGSNRGAMRARSCFCLTVIELSFWMIHHCRGRGRILPTKWRFAPPTCMQIQGGIALATDLPIETFRRRQRSFRITEGAPAR
ncbi:MAG: hypothetical protein ACREH9_02070 [Pseudomonadota bacterium]